MMNNRIPENQLLAEDTVRPIPFFVIVILWAVGLYVIPSTILSFFEPIPEGVPDFFRFHILVFDGLGVILVPVIMVVLITGFTAIYIMFPGVRYRIFIDRIDFERGKYPRFRPTQTLYYSELDSIYWSEQRPDNRNATFIEFHFTSQIFQLHTEFFLSRQVAEVCRLIERTVIVPKYLSALAKGDTLTFLPPDKSPSFEIGIDNEKIEKIAEWEQRHFSWSDIRTIRFSKGKISDQSDFLVQCRIRIENAFGEAIEFDMPTHNPHAFWAVLKGQCNSPELQVLNYPKKESFA